MVYAQARIRIKFSGGVVEIQTGHIIPVRKIDLVIIEKKKKKNRKER